MLTTLSKQLRRGELAADNISGIRVVAASSGGAWHASESQGRERWTWSRGTADLVLRTERTGAVVTLEFETRSLSPRSIRVTTKGRELWQGLVGTDFTTVELSPLLLNAGLTTVRIETDTPPVLESSDPAARALAFVVHAPRLR